MSDIVSTEVQKDLLWQRAQGICAGRFSEAESLDDDIAALRSELESAEIAVESDVQSSDDLLSDAVARCEESIQSLVRAAAPLAEHRAAVGAERARAERQQRERAGLEHDIALIEGRLDDALKGPLCLRCRERKADTVLSPCMHCRYLCGACASSCANCECGSAVATFWGLR
eukprot:TRINITY_DN10973_c0_g1_i1.p1 TRINITY_DN10973_c0_g1~~TRINITY_DN10973_c0_g1_i1.p1  ORF type:complete len:190 (+),score=16.13 TRINITY_DN10973_c0_g1_i1:55-570(+)